MSGASGPSSELAVHGSIQRAGNREIEEMIGMLGVIRVCNLRSMAAYNVLVIGR